MIVSIAAASNGNAEYFDLIITYNPDGLNLSESYANLTLGGATPTIAESYFGLG